MASIWASLLGLAVLRLLTGAAAVSLHVRDGRIVTPSPKANFTGDDWALLIAGSSGWGNYRHQADICHAYQVLRQGGLPEERIVVMMADDIAHNPLNPHLGKIFNQPGGSDVYEGVPKDYTGSSVNVQNFTSALIGDKDSLVGLGTTGKVIASGPNDRVFVYFSDHGAPGILGMPFGPFLYGDQIRTALRAKAHQKGFAELVVYIEACESGSIMQGMIDDSLTIYATTAANAFESSWGCYCPGMQPGPGSEFTTCLGDLYSVAFLENSDKANLANETLEVQYELVRQRTSNNYSYIQGSHVMQFGSHTIDEEPAGDYLGIRIPAHLQSDFTGLQSRAAQGVVPQRDADLLHLWTMVERAAPGQPKAAALARLSAEASKRVVTDAAVRCAVHALLHRRRTGALLQAHELDSALEAGLSEEVEQVTTAPGARDPALPLVDDWTCLRGMVEAWQAAPGCGHLMDQYGMQYSRAFANLCNDGYTVQDLTAVLGSVPPCSTASTVLEQA